MVWRIPAGYRVREAALDDVGAVVELTNACSRELLGVCTRSVEDQRADWQSPAFDPQRDVRVVLAPDTSIIGYADVWDVDEPHVRIHSWGRVHPDHRARGIGSSLLRWIERRASESVSLAPAGSRVCLYQSVFEQDADAQDLLKQADFKLSRVYSRMVVTMDMAPPAPSWPDGVRVRPYSGRDLAATVQAVQSAFRDHWGYVEACFEDELKQWEHWTTAYEDFDPSLWFLATAESTGEIAGVVLGWPKTPEDPEMGWVEVLGVVRSWRRRGLAVALLQHALSEFYRRGNRRVGLGVDAASLTGATRLYERAGMKTVRRTLSYEKELRPGKDLSRRDLVGS